MSTDDSAAGLARIAYDHVVKHSQAIAMVMNQIDEIAGPLREASESLVKASGLLRESSHMLTDSEDAEGVRLGIHASSLDSEVHALIRMMALCKGKAFDMGSVAQQLMSAIESYYNRLEG